ncbi:DUF6059 family protein [Micromonospora inyonensis]|uniref:Uncharacterized protein n=1 Tax=Micromonospora inyonensis TaxID=47866 RepID=A0A1C6SL61_9ACTN|nr:DUF6059 family protein [Micromonospora inyonensis]SCL30152.1 hypothetical protein GA0074694_5611 [Micromonospora inyonensis]
MDAYRVLSRCGRLTVSLARELFSGLKAFGAALIGTPLPPEAFPPATPPAGGPVPTVTDATCRPVGGEPGQPPSPVEPGTPWAGTEPGAPPAGHPERLIPHVPPTPVERRLWSQLR